MHDHGDGTPAAGGAVLDLDHRSPYRPLRRRARWTLALLALVMLVDAIGLWSGARERSVLAEIAAGEIVSDAEITASDRRQALIGTAQAVLFTLTATAFLAWFYRAYANLPALGAGELRYGRRWAIGAWFIPFLNLWRPKQITNDIWRASDPDAPPAQGLDWHTYSVPRLFTFWWAGFLVSQWLYQTSFRLNLRSDEVDDFTRVNALTNAADALSLVTAALAIAVVRRTTKRQETRASALGLTPEEVPAPLYRQRSAWATLVAAVLALGLQGGLLLAVWSGTLVAREPGAQTDVPREASDPTLLLADNFSEPREDLWLVDRSGAASLGYAGEAYRIEVMRKRYEQHSYVTLNDPVEALRLQVEGRMQTGTRLDGYGLGCWVGEERGYYAQIYGDGFYAITKDPGRAQIQALATGTDRADVINRNKRPNRLRFECTRTTSDVRLVLWVNGKRLVAASDPKPLDSFSALGVFAYSSSGRTDVRFDDFIARDVTPAA